jgi:hypothetical protein
MMDAIVRMRSHLHGSGLLNGPSTSVRQCACCADLAASRAEHGFATLVGGHVQCREGPARYATAAEMHL